MDYKDRLRVVHERIADACARSGRSEDAVQLIGVTKYSTAEETKALIEAGCSHVAESKMQDAIPKIDLLADLPATWHFIGYLQTNKVKQLLPGFRYLHSLDRLSLAEEINKRFPKEKLFCFIQVNVSREETKSGVEEDHLMQFVDDLKQYPVIQVCGLMTMAPKFASEEETRNIFRKLREWRDTLQRSTYLGQECRYLSMGMSNDFEIAIEEGATHIRLGSIITK